jgi:hypothetical protein
MKSLMLAVAFVAVVYPTVVGILCGMAQRPEIFRPGVILDAALTSPDGPAIAIVLLLILAWSAAFLLGLAVRGVRQAVSARWWNRSQFFGADRHRELRVDRSVRDDIL